MFEEVKVNGVEGIFLKNKENDNERELLNELESSTELKEALSDFSKRFLEIYFDEDGCRKIVEDKIIEKNMDDIESAKLRELSHMLYRV